MPRSTKRRTRIWWVLRSRKKRRRNVRRRNVRRKVSQANERQVKLKPRPRRQLGSPRNPKPIDFLVDIYMLIFFDLGDGLPTNSNRHLLEYQQLYLRVTRGNLQHPVMKFNRIALAGYVYFSGPSPCPCQNAQPLVNMCSWCNIYECISRRCKYLTTISFWCHWTVMAMGQTWYGAATYLGSRLR